MALNFSNTTPSPPVNAINILWTSDVSGNLSGSVSSIPVKTTLDSVAGVLTIDANLGNSFLINITENISSSSITNPTDGQEITLLWSQDATGRTIVLPANLQGATAPSTAASAFSCQQFSYDVASDEWFATGVGVINMS